jgi:hypothetical protein
MGEQSKGHTLAQGLPQRSVTITVRPPAEAEPRKPWCLVGK